MRVDICPSQAALRRHSMKSSRPPPETWRSPCRGNLRRRILLLRAGRSGLALSRLRSISPPRARPVCAKSATLGNSTEHVERGPALKRCRIFFATWTLAHIPACCARTRIGYTVVARRGSEATKCHHPSLISPISASPPIRTPRAPGGAAPARQNIVSCVSCGPWW